MNSPFRYTLAALLPLQLFSLILLSQPLAAEPAKGTPDEPVGETPTDVAVAKPVTANPIQVFGWREYIHMNGVPAKLIAKLDTGATTSSIHAEQKELFERDGKKWVRFVITDPTNEKSEKTRVEAPLVRVVKIKEPGGESIPREVVKLGFELGGHKMRGEFTLNNRNNMTSPVLIGRNLLQELGVVDSSRVFIADQKIFE